MSDSTLDPDNIPAGADRVLGRGHGTRALGPSDNSDSGSDVGGEPQNELDSDTDAEGTGERPGVGRDSVEGQTEIGFDHVETIPATEREYREAAESVDDDDTANREVPPQQPRDERRDWSRSDG